MTNKKAHSGGSHTIDVTFFFYNPTNTYRILRTLWEQGKADQHMQTSILALSGLPFSPPFAIAGALYEANDWVSDPSLGIEELTEYI